MQEKKREEREKEREERSRKSRNRNRPRREEGRQRKRESANAMRLGEDGEVRGPELVRAKHKERKPGLAPQKKGRRQNEKEAEEEPSRKTPRPIPEKYKRRHCTDKRPRKKRLSTSDFKSSLPKIYRKQKVRPEQPSKKRRARQVELCQKKGCTPERQTDRKTDSISPFQPKKTTPTPPPTPSVKELVPKNCPKKRRKTHELNHKAGKKTEEP